ncbi:GDP-mannose 4,6-dehydratase [Marinospirillum perlucidum]|uniref:GDP-mannose 4,6-dehydratase n=1 Tax=Marinospirillum perlucidum TaxID=1982602 RepID=UPI001C4981DD|nr:GDP-mannose 4,6-dehydratase [Marinospirillum perlucidum]
MMEIGSGQRVLVTGINGFTGRYMAASLRDAGYEVFGTETTFSNTKGVFQLDLTDSSAVSQLVGEIKPHKVVHLAALSFVGHGDPAAFYAVNLVGTRNLLAALASLDATPDSVLLASSANVYGNAQEGVLDERALVQPANDYAVSKLSMEQMAALWMKDLPLIITRPFNYTGVGQDEKFLIPKIVRHFNDRAPIIELGNLDVWRDFNDVRSLIFAYKELLSTPEAIGMTFNVCSGKTLSLREILAQCEAISGHKIKVEVNPAFVRANEVKSLCGDPSRLKNLIPEWNPLPFKQTLSWMLRA